MPESTKLDGFFEWLRKSNLSAPFVKLTTRTKPKLLAASRVVYPEGVERLAVRIGQCGSSYENAVRNLTEDETFIAEQLWHGHGIHVQGNRWLVTHKEKGGLYITFRPREHGGSLMIPDDKWFDAATKNIIEKPVKFLPKESPPKTGVYWRTVAVENIVRIEAGAIFDYD